MIQLPPQTSLDMHVVDSIRPQPAVMTRLQQVQGPSRKVTCCFADGLFHFMHRDNGPNIEKCWVLAQTIRHPSL